MGASLILRLANSTGVSLMENVHSSIKVMGEGGVFRGSRKQVIKFLILALPYDVGTALVKYGGKMR
jgi:hypothetical protein